MPVRIYAFAKELGFDNKQLLDICDSAGIDDKGSALASLSDEEVVVIKQYLANPPPAEEEEVYEPEESDVVEVEDPQPVEEPVAEEVTVETAEPEVPAPVAEEEVVAEPVAEEPVVEEPVVEQTPEPVAEAVPEVPVEETGKPKSVVGGLLGKLRSRSREAFPSVKATTGKPAIKKESIKDKEVVAKADVPKKPVEKPVPVAPIKPSTSTAPVRNPLFNRGQKAVRDLDSRKQKSESGDEKKRPAKKRGITANVAKMPDVKQPSVAYRRFL